MIVTGVYESPNPDSVGAGFPEEEISSDESDWLCIYGCVDYHMSDCPTRGNYSIDEPSDFEYGEADYDPYAY